MVGKKQTNIDKVKVIKRFDAVSEYDSAKVRDLGSIKGAQNVGTEGYKDLLNDVIHAMEKNGAISRPSLTRRSTKEEKAMAFMDNFQDMSIEGFRSEVLDKFSSVIGKENGVDIVKHDLEIDQNKEVQNNSNEESVYEVPVPIKPGDDFNQMKDASSYGKGENPFLNNDKIETEDTYADPQGSYSSKTTDNANKNLQDSHYENPAKMRKNRASNAVKELQKDNAEPEDSKTRDRSADQGNKNTGPS